MQSHIVMGIRILDKKKGSSEPFISLHLYFASISQRLLFILPLTVDLFRLSESFLFTRDE